jgi:hypothetical protein
MVECRVTTKAESQKDSADIGRKPVVGLAEEVTRDEIIAALMALPSESQPAAAPVSTAFSTT